jgi:hypothetical protein
MTLCKASDLKLEIDTRFFRPMLVLNWALRGGWGGYIETIKDGKGVAGRCQES